VLGRIALATGGNDGDGNDPDASRHDGRLYRSGTPLR
jgi:hypothetical protein